MALSLLFFGLNRYSISILFVEIILSYFSKLKMLVGMTDRTMSRTMTDRTKTGVCSAIL